MRWFCFDILALYVLIVRVDGHPKTSDESWHATPPPRGMVGFVKLGAINTCYQYVLRLHTMNICYE